MEGILQHGGSEGTNQIEMIAVLRANKMMDMVSIGRATVYCTMQQQPLPTSSSARASDEFLRWSAFFVSPRGLAQKQRA